MKYSRHTESFVIGPTHISYIYRKKGQHVLYSPRILIPTPLQASFTRCPPCQNLVEFRRNWTYFSGRPLSSPELDRPNPWRTHRHLPVPYLYPQETGGSIGVNCEIQQHNNWCVPSLHQPSSNTSLVESAKNTPEVVLGIYSATNKYKSIDGDSLNCPTYWVIAGRSNHMGAWSTS